MAIAADFNIEAKTITFPIPADSHRYTVWELYQYLQKVEDEAVSESIIFSMEDAEPFWQSLESKVPSEPGV